MEFHAVPSVPPEVCERNTALARALGLPEVERAGHVAVVGGGPSLVGNLDVLRSWEGPIWAVNETFMWLKARGIKSTFFTADPKPQPWLKAERGDSALVALHGSPELFASLSEAYVRTYRLADDAVHCGPTTATAASHLALWMGHRSVTFFGCDSSFEGSGYVHDRAPPGDLIEVRADRVYLTKPEFLMQADNLAAFCREFAFCKNRSGGLLKALVENPERTVLGYREKAVA